MPGTCVSIPYRYPKNFKRKGIKTGDGSKVSIPYRYPKNIIFDDALSLNIAFQFLIGILKTFTYTSILINIQFQFLIGILKT